MMSWSSKKKKKTFFVPFILSEGKFFKICVLYQCIVYRLHFQNIHTFKYQKTLLHTILLLIFKIVESLHCTLTAFLFLCDDVKQRMKKAMAGLNNPLDFHLETKDMHKNV